MAEQDEGYINIMKQVVVPIEEKDFIINNPEGLTIEGVKFNIKQHEKRPNSRSGNKYIVAKFKLMLNSFKDFSKSGKLQNGKTILSRDGQGNVTWSEMIDENFNLVQVVMGPIEVK